MPTNDDDILLAMEFFDVGHCYKFSANYQSWEFPGHFRISFKPSDSAERRREMIKQGYDLAHRVLKSDIRNNMANMRATVGDHPVLDQIEGYLK